LLQIPDCPGLLRRSTIARRFAQTGMRHAGEFRRRAQSSSCSFSRLQPAVERGRKCLGPTLRSAWRVMQRRVRPIRSSRRLNEPRFHCEVRQPSGPFVMGTVEPFKRRVDVAQREMNQREDDVPLPHHESRSGCLASDTAGIRRAANAMGRQRDALRASGGRPVPAGRTAFAAERRLGRGFQ
jgi:hypothetical protein